MSGDVQTRKRKDKKKRKDDGIEGSSSIPSNEDVNIHIHKDGGTGGNICGKIVFFFLFSALVVLIGLIIKENQGLNDLENTEVESRFSQMFEGWVEQNPEEHDNDDNFPETEQDHDDDENNDNYESDEGNVEDVEEESQEYEDQDNDEDDDNESTLRSEEETNEEETEEQLIESEDDSPIEESDEIEEIDGESEEKIKDETEENISDEAEKSEEQIKSEETKEQESKEILEPIVKESDGTSETKEKASEELEHKIEEGNTLKESSSNINVGEEESDSRKASEDEIEYEHSDITNEDDYRLKDDIDEARDYLKKNAAYANKLFEALLQKYPLSPRSLYGKAQALDILAEQKQSNDLLQQALSYYAKALNAGNVPDQLYTVIASRYIDRARFMGQYKKAVEVHWQLIQRFPDNVTYLNNLAVTYLTINLVEEARAVLKRALDRWPNNGFALVHYGFILKTTDNNLQESIDYIDRGLKTKAEGVVDGRFYFHLGDALARLNQPNEAMKIYEEGVKEKVFMSKYQRSLYNVPRLTAKPWWESKDLPSYQKLLSDLKNNWREIRKEGLSALDSHGYFKDEAENLKDTGTWKQFELFARGHKYSKNCAKSPITCGIIQSFPDAANCRRGQTKFSVMHPGTHVWPHCGPTNCRLRIHLGLKIPPNTFIRVADKTKSWKEGDVIIFDDSFEHEVWHNGSDFRLVLIVDIWHPELTPSERQSLTSI